MDIKLKKITPNEIDLLKNEMKKSFTQGVIDRFRDPSAAPIPSDSDITRVLNDSCCDIFIITADTAPAGAAIIKHGQNRKYSLELFFIFKDFLNKKIGSAAWQVIERHYPDAEIWETCTPYFERRNIHFYLHKCGFKIVEFFSEYHKDEHDLTDKFKDINTSGFFRFEKIIK